MKKAHGGVVLENKGKVLRSCADRTVSSNSRCVIYFACLSGRSYLSPDERSIMYSMSWVRNLVNIVFSKGYELLY